MHNYIENVTIENTGGGCWVDFVHLKSGKVIGISDEAACIYPSMASFYDEDEFYQDTPTIFFPATLGEWYDRGIAAWIKETTSEGPIDWIVLKDGLRIMVAATEIRLVVATLPL